MKPEELVQSLQESYVMVNFVKKDGSERKMRCTLNVEMIPLEKQPKNATERKVNTEVLPVFDLDLNEWRSFRLDSVTSYSYN